MAASDPGMDTAALLVIDIQDNFKASPRWAQRNNPQFEANVTELIRAFRAAGRPVIYFLHSDSDPGWTTDSPHYRLMDFLDRRDDEMLLHKTSHNGFTTTQLGRVLQKQGVRRIVVTGIRTEQCCETTARVGFDLGYDVDFVTEATLTFPSPKSSEPGAPVLSAEDMVERTEYALRGRFARIVTVADIVAQCTVLSS
jgi:nicotinamidase-related amidase